MSTNANQNREDEYLSTREAAKRLGVSLGTVQNMVEGGRLRAWKTAGGHRRVSLRSVEACLQERAGMTAVASGGDRLRVTIAEADPEMVELYRQQFANWGMPIDTKVFANGYDCLLDLCQDRPDVLIADLMLPGVDGFQYIRALRDRSEFASMRMIVISAMSNDELAEKGGLPPDVTVYGKPLPGHELRGYFQALITQRALV